MNMKRAVRNYIKRWECRGYSDGIPDEVPYRIMWLRRAPSYKAICLAILRNNPGDLGANLPVSAWYSELKRIELTGTTTTKADQAGRLKQRWLDFIGRKP